MHQTSFSVKRDCFIFVTMRNNQISKDKKSEKNKKIKKGILESTGTALLILLTITTIVYFKSLFLDYTRLDDTIFIVENSHYNADIKNIGVSFQRGLFNPTKDAYYRPIFLVDFIIESKFFGTAPAGYHFTNLLFHLISVSLLYLLLKKFRLSHTDTFLLTLIFAVHPVLTQAVVWIPGRNDMLLMIFFLSGFLMLLKYLESQSYLALLSHTMLFLIAMFTKETAVIIPLIMIGFVLFYFKIPWKKMIFPAICWTGAVLIWFIVRSQATLSGNWATPASMIMTGISRLGVIIQYLGKIFLPVNLSVFPEYEDITMIWGIIALGVFIGLIIYSKAYKMLMTYLGLFWFLVFLVPVLIVPKSLNDQVFEHRLYLPLVGILLMISQVFPFTGKISEKHKTIIISVIAIIFSSQSFYRTDYFKDPVTFWTRAVEGSPHSAYAHTLLGTKVADTIQREALFRKAYKLNPDLKNLNYYIGKVLFERKDKDSAKYFIQRELRTNSIPDAWFLLAQISFEENSFDSAAMCLEKVIELDPYNSQANHNLALLYYQRGKKDKAREVLNQMQNKGMTPGEDLINLINRP